MRCSGDLCGKIRGKFNENSKALSSYFLRYLSLQNASVDRSFLVYGFSSYHVVQNVCM